MEERAAGGEVLRRPQEWCTTLLFSSQPPFGLRERVAKIADRPLTRLEYIEELAFSGKGRN